MNQVIERTSIGEGLGVEFVHRGRRSGDPIVCLHGVTDSWHSFEPVFDELAPDIEAFAFSQRGHGDSDRPDGGYELGQLARDVAEFMRAVGIGRAVIVGHSMGAMVAQRLAIDFPEMVSGLVLMGAMADMAGNSDVQEFYEEAIELLDGEVDPELARGFQESTLAQPIDPGLLDLFISESLKAPARVWKGAFEGFKDVNLVPELAKISAPTLILWGAQDNFARRAEQDAIVGAIPDASLIVFPELGHALYWEAPDQISREIERFVSER